MVRLGAQLILLYELQEISHSLVRELASRRVIVEFDEVGGPQQNP